MKKAVDRAKKKKKNKQKKLEKEKKKLKPMILRDWLFFMLINKLKLDYIKLSYLILLLKTKNLLIL